jgi:hypothetical protein
MAVAGKQESPAAEQAEELTAAKIGEVALDHVARLTGKKTNGVTSVEPTDDGWQVDVEVVEENRIPSSADMLATFQVDLDMTGELLSYRRTRRYSRGQHTNGEVS